MDAAAILAIGDEAPHRLFAFEDDAAKRQYHDLVKAWHPDTSPDPAQAIAVFQRISALWRSRNHLIGSGEWPGGGEKAYIEAGGKLFRLRYRRRDVFELGATLVADTAIAFEITTDFAHLSRAFREAESKFSFADAKMKDEVRRYLPTTIKTFETKTSHVRVIEKTPDLIQLRHLFQHFDSKIDPRHIAWIMNRLYSLLCWLEWRGLVHNAISMENYYVSPQYHSGALLGGWWYSAPNGGAITQVPARTAALMPSDIRRKKIADPRADLELAKALGRELLDNPAGIRTKWGSTPEPMRQFLIMPSSGSALTDFETWGNACKKSYGARRFVEMKVSESDIYGRT